MAEAAAHAVKAAFAALMAGGGTVFVILILIVGIIGGAAFIGSSQSSEPLSAEVLAHTPAIQRYAREFGISEYVPVIQAIMMQESGGRGTDPMQASECPYNTQYPNTPGAIIFFDWEHDGTCDHVGIVERCDGTTVYTIEGNSGDAVKERSYSISSDSIMGYGMVVY